MREKTEGLGENPVILTTLWNDDPEAATTSPRKRITASVCSSMLPVTSLPVSGSIGGAPEMKTNPFALTAAEMGTLYLTKASEMPGTWTISFIEFSCDSEIARRVEDRCYFTASDGSQSTVWGKKIITSITTEFSSRNGIVAR